MNDYREKTLQEIATKGGQIGSRMALVGFDGFVDRIVHVVDERSGPGPRFRRMEKMEDFGRRVMDAAGQSTNVELYPVAEKVGGNGPIMAEALQASGMDVRYIGALGRDSIHPVFREFAAKTQAVSVGDPGITHALEFGDGKLMLGMMQGFEEIDYARILKKGGEGMVTDLISRADVLSFVNWTMLPHMTGILNGILERILPNLGPKDYRAFFFDLCDPEKRSDGDLNAVLALLKRFGYHGKAVLGMNLREALRVDRVSGGSDPEPTPAGLKAMAARIRKRLDVAMVVIHPVDGAACANRMGEWYTPGPFTERPKITTGAGDLFNAGFMVGDCLGMSPESCLVLGVAYSGWYVRHASSPSLQDVESFIQQWKSDLPQFS